ncbi:hypothetical protein [Clostridium perfringens]|uniref:hypothetical protein n=1 Tax=Clostridium perfringens TaxID=1502 RepID=UPI0018E4B053|nr:hypothetical protein [Clostridium perfringens]MBI6014758.1 hypothetical protein [Clostridium perfringens]MDM0541750.1 hypothetical protein [Clostridium perfringens]
MGNFPKFKDIGNNSKGSIVQSDIFGHRFKSDQNIDEYLLEFLQVVISEKKLYVEGEGEKITKAFFPLIDKEKLEKIEFFPESKIDLKRFVFYMNSKDESRSKIDDDAYYEMINFIKDKIDISCDYSKKDVVKFIEKLLLGFSGVTKNRSWYAQSFLPICNSMILPETMIEKKARRNLDKDFEIGGIDFEYGKVDTECQTNRYNFMARGGEVYYLHVLRGLIKNPKYREELTNLLEKQLNEYKQIETLSDTIHKIWVEGIKEKYEGIILEKKITKKLGFIPIEFGKREDYTVAEITNFLKSDMHPFEKIEILSKGIVFQLINLMHSEARYYIGKNTRQAWVVDMTYNFSKNKELKKIAANSYDTLEDDMTNAISNRIYETEKYDVDDKDSKFKYAIDDSYKLCRKLAKDIGVLVPLKGSGMRFTLQENILKFLVVSIIKPGGKLTLTTFIEKLYEHFGIIIGRNEYKKAMEDLIVEPISDFSCFDENEKALSEMLKRCNFLRDLSDATSIVENPYLN